MKIRATHRVLAAALVLGSAGGVAVAAGADGAPADGARLAASAADDGLATLLALHRAVAAGDYSCLAPALRPSIFGCPALSPRPQPEDPATARRPDPPVRPARSSG